MAGESGPLAQARDWWRGLSGSQRFFAVFLLLAPLVLLHWRDGRNLTLLMAGLPGLWFGFRVGFLRFSGIGARRALILVWLFLGVALFSWAVSGFTDLGWRWIERYDRLLFFLPWLISLLWLRPPAVLLWLALGLGGMAAGLGAVLEIALSGEGLSHRVGGETHPMSFGIIAGMLATLLLAAAWQWRARAGMALFLLTGAVLALLAMALTGTRAGPLGLLTGLVGLALVLAWFGDRRGAALFAAVPVALAVLALAFADVGVVKRFVRGGEQLQDYFRIEAVMPPRIETALGCQDDPRLLRGWLMSHHQSGIGALQAQVLETGPAPCGAGPRLRFEAAEDAVRLRLPRGVPADQPEAPAVLYLRGEGASLRIADGEWRDSETQWQRAELRPEAEAGESLVIRLAAGGWLELLPEARIAGEYRYPHADPSVGQRLEMWRLALQLFAERPLLGHGVGQYGNVTAPLVEQGLAGRKVQHYRQAHNEYLEALATRGLVGFAALLLLLAGLIYISLRPGPGHSRDARHPGLPFAGAFLALSGSLVFDAILSMNITNVTVAFLLALSLYLGNHGTAPGDWTRNRLAFWR